MRKDVEKSYMEALERLINNQPIKVPLGTPVSNDAVALEAGRGRGSLKKSRYSHRKVLIAIEASKTNQSSVKTKTELSLKRQRNKTANVQAELEASLAREVLLLATNYDLEKQLLELQKIRP